MSRIAEQMKRYNYLVSELDAAYHWAANKLGLSDSAMQVLYTVCFFGGSCLLSDIYQLSGVSKQTINSSFRKLEAGGYVRLETHSGLRKAVFFTEAGKEKAENTVAKIIELENRVFHSWPEEDREKYLELTKRYLNDFREGVRQFEYAPGEGAPKKESL